MNDVTALQVDPSNAGQARAWDGDEGDFWAEHAEHFDRALGAYHEQFMASAEIQETDRVLDLGCGAGQTTRHAALAASSGSALGVDLSGQMIELARRLATEQGVTNAGFEQADAQIHHFAPASFDVAISRTGTMFFGDPSAAFTNVARALRTSGRLVMLVWQGPGPNEWIRQLTGALAAERELGEPPIGVPGPFAQADPDQVKGVLESAGFGGVSVRGLEKPMWFGAHPQDATTFVLGLMGWMLEGLDEPGRVGASELLAATCRAHHTADGVVFGSGAWLVTATRGTGDTR